ncbi:MAG TPA: hypothetical protein VJ719_02520, partial [Chthoniobacterales bacterium]|nr:hypothetical protein [Chthoniobacterales bacterium]
MMTGAEPTLSETSPGHRGAVWKFARAISWIGHPLVFASASLTLVVIFRLANRVGLSVLSVLIVAVVLPTAWLLARGVRLGQWSDADVSIRTERTRFYPRAILLWIGGIVALLLLRAPSFIVQGAMVTVALLVIAALINRFLKISLHALFAFYCTVILLRINLFSGLIALALAILVVWSRLYLRRHALPDILAGTALGVIGALAT